jgi:hypothetical protein
MLAIRRHARAWGTQRHWQFLIAPHLQGLDPSPVSLVSFSVYMHARATLLAHGPYNDEAVYMYRSEQKAGRKSKKWGRWNDT